MKTKSLLLFSTSLVALLLAGCTISTGGSNKKRKSSSGDSLTSSKTDSTSGSTTRSGTVTYSTGTYVPTSTSDPDWGGGDITGDFSVVNEAGQQSGYTVSGSVVTIGVAGTYTLTGSYNGRIVVDVDESETVELDLNGVSITSSDNAPIFAKSADKLKIKAVKDTTNQIIDNRSKKTSDSDDQGEGAIAAKCDLNLIGKGTLSVEGNYNNGVHTSKDLKIKNIQLKSYGYQHAIRGGNSIEVVNATTYIKAIAATGDGFKSNDAGVNSNNKQKGNICFYGGTTVIHSKEDGVDAAYDLICASGTDEDSGETTIPTINIYTDKYATLTKGTYRPGPGGGGPGGGGSEGNTNKSSTTAKGLKGSNTIQISDGQIYIKAYDDGLHANSEALTDSDGNSTGKTGLGNVTISGGTITIDCSDDGMHADNTLSITDNAIINVTNSYEGLEGTIINVSGGTTRVYGTNDGINASGGSPAINISGGFFEISVNPNGDVDGIDSNGTFNQTGGVVVAKGPNQSMASALDHEGRATINGGTLVVLGAIEGQNTNVTIGSAMKSYSLSLHSSGSHTFTVNGNSYSINNSYSYSKTICYSDSAVTGS